MQKLESLPHISAHGVCGKPLGEAVYRLYQDFFARFYINGGRNFAANEISSYFAIHIISFALPESMICVNVIIYRDNYSIYTVCSGGIAYHQTSPDALRRIFVKNSQFQNAAAVKLRLHYWNIGAEIQIIARNVIKKFIR